MAQLKNEIVAMADIALGNFNRSIRIISTLDFSETGDFKTDEEELNFLNGALIDFLVKLSADRRLSEADHAYLASCFHTVSDLERVGDYAENIVECAATLRDGNDSFSPEALAEIKELGDKMEELYTNVMLAYEHRDREALKRAEEVEDEIDDLTDAMGQKHIQRLREQACTPTAGAQYLSLATNAERIADHFLNVAHTMLK